MQMKRIPRGGKKVNYTLYMTAEDRDRIKDRAQKLGMTDAYYVLQLLEMDLQGDLMPHFDAGGAVAQVIISDTSIPEQPVQEENIALPPGKQTSAEVIAKAQEAMQEGVKASFSQEPIALPEDETVSETPAQVVVQRPQMKQIADILAEQGGVFGLPGGQQQQKPSPRDPGAHISQVRAAGTGGQQWADRMHREVLQGESGETSMRKQILESLLPAEEAE